MIAIQMGGLIRRMGMDGLQVVLLSSSPGHIDVKITFPNSFVTRATRFYGHPDPSQRVHS